MSRIIDISLHGNSPGSGRTNRWIVFEPDRLVTRDNYELGDLCK